MDHKFYDIGADLIISEYEFHLNMFSDDYCINCEKTLQEIIPEYNLEYFEEHSSLIDKLKILNNKFPCLTDEEFKIKNILK